MFHFLTQPHSGACHTTAETKTVLMTFALHRAFDILRKSEFVMVELLCHF